MGGRKRIKVECFLKPVRWQNVLDRQSWIIDDKDCSSAFLKRTAGDSTFNENRFQTWTFYSLRSHRNAITTTFSFTSTLKLWKDVSWYLLVSKYFVCGQNVCKINKKSKKPQAEIKIKSENFFLETWLVNFNFLLETLKVNELATTIKRQKLDIKTSTLIYKSALA